MEDKSVDIVEKEESTKFREIMAEVDRILSLVDDCKYLVAFDEYNKLNTTLSEDAIELEKKKTVREAFEVHKVKIDQMIERAKEIQSTLDFEDTNSNWILGANHFGILTHYRNVEEDDSIVLKMEGVLDNLPLFEQCAVIHEIDLFKEWAPMCSESKTIEKFSAADLMA